MGNEKVVLAVSGKGGVGKTTLVALMTKLLSEAKRGSMLVIDGNPDSNLGNLLGVQADSSVAKVTEELKKALEKSEISPAESKMDILESKVFGAVEETEDFDFLVMGRSEGEGCYCLINKLLANIIDTLSKNYDVTLMDEAAGLEHLSRRTDRDVDVMVIVTDPSSMGFQTARRIKELAPEVHIDFKQIFLVGNRFPAEAEPVLREEAKKMGIELAGSIPHDDGVLEYNLKGRPVVELGPESSAMSAVRDILKRIGLLKQDA